MDFEGRSKIVLLVIMSEKVEKKSFSRENNKFVQMFDASMGGLEL